MNDLGQEQQGGGSEGFEIPCEKRQKIVDNITPHVEYCLFNFQRLRSVLVDRARALSAGLARPRRRQRASIGRALEIWLAGGTRERQRASKQAGLSLTPSRPTATLHFKPRLARHRIAR